MILRSMSVALQCGVSGRPMPYPRRWVHVLMAGSRQGLRAGRAAEETGGAGGASGFVAPERLAAERRLTLAAGVPALQGHGAAGDLTGPAGVDDLTGGSAQAGPTGMTGVLIVAGAPALTGGLGLSAAFDTDEVRDREVASVEDLVTAHVGRFDDRALIAHSRDWRLMARPEQLPPEGDWRTWLLMGGRGSGKTRAGAEWVHGLASGEMPGLGRDGRIALVAKTFGDAREVMVDGMSGILGVARDGRPLYEATRRRLVWPSGAVAQMFSSEDPESLRGPQFDLAWCDELGKWRHARETWDMLQFALRLGAAPRQLVTTTPRATPLMLALVKDPATRVTRIRTEDNAAHLAAGFLDAIRARYGGTRLGR
ncbi:terminase family protein, partial [Hoeflea sp. BAL378]|uniref:terminase large subunit domain-containing protein n=1 Tax=Hoeflea sp. BAL378 TaxID=1547437 RepID=UPI001FCA6364